MPVDLNSEHRDAERPCIIIAHDRHIGGDVWRLCLDDHATAASAIGYPNFDEAVAAARDILHPRFSKLPIYVAPRLGGYFWGWTE